MAIIALCLSVVSIMVSIVTLVILLLRFTFDTQLAAANKKSELLLAVSQLQVMVRTLDRYAPDDKAFMEEVRDHLQPTLDIATTLATGDRLNAIQLETLKGVLSNAAFAIAKAVTPLADKPTPASKPASKP